MSNPFWNVDEMQQIFDESTESIITKAEIADIGDRLKSEGYRLINVPKLFEPGKVVIDESPLPARTKFFLQVGEQLHPLVETVIAILRESLERDKSDERKVKIALEMLRIAFTSGMVDL